MYCAPSSPDYASNTGWKPSVRFTKASTTLVGRRSFRSSHSNPELTRSLTSGWGESGLLPRGHPRRNQCHARERDDKDHHHERQTAAPPPERDPGWFVEIVPSRRRLPNHSAVDEADPGESLVDA